MHGIEQQFLALQKGFNELIPQSLLKVGKFEKPSTQTLIMTIYLQAFDERELELVIGGLGTIDLQDWKTNTRLKHCTVETPQVRVAQSFNAVISSLLRLSGSGI